MHASVLDYLNDNGYDNVDDGLYMARVGSCMISIRYYTKSTPDMIRWASNNNVELPDRPYYSITRLVGMDYDETYLTDDDDDADVSDDALIILKYLNDKSKSPTTNEAIAIHGSMNRMVDMMNDKTGNVGRFNLPSII